MDGSSLNSIAIILICVVLLINQSIIRMIFRRIKKLEDR